MKYLVFLFCFIATTFAQTNTNVDYLGRPTEWNGIPILYGGPAKPCIPICVYDKLEEFTNAGGAAIYICGTNAWDISDVIPIPNSEYINTNKQWNAEDFICTNAFWLNQEWYEHTNSRLTWVYKNFEGRVTVTFDVDGWGFSDSTRRLLEEEIAKAIQDIIDLHFPKEDK